jgi:UDP-N-acetylmuramate dehydrogenase
MSVLEYLSLKPYNTFGIDACARYFCRVQTKEDMLHLIADEFQYHHKQLIIGGGSNILLCDDYDGLVIKNEITGIEKIKEDEAFVWLKSYSGTVWHDLVMYAVQHNYGGIENMALIPGTAGAAPMQNIGAYGVELKDVFVELEAIDLQTGEQHIFDKAACDFGYRHSVFKTTHKGQYFIYSVTLRLSRYPQPNVAYGDIRKTLAEWHISSPSIKEVADAVMHIRRSKLPDPAVLGNAGSFFKNPEVSDALAADLLAQYPDMPHYPLPDNRVKIPAGWLIEQCGWKGKRVGHTGNHAQQALVIVNYGDASGPEIWQHAQEVQASVQKKFGILLDAEVNIVR